ncbi:hypothetical protein LCGC14_2775450, partial [marine sediment metagenome]
MTTRLRTGLYILLAVLMLLTLNSIFNTGNPNSIFRILIKSTAYDLVITLSLAATVFVLVVLLTLGRDNLTHLLTINGEQVKVKIPMGIADGTKIRLRGRGGPGANGGPNG